MINLHFSLGDMMTNRQDRRFARPQAARKGCAQGCVQ